MLNGLGKTLEKKLPVSDRRRHVAEQRAPYGSAQLPYGVAGAEDCIWILLEIQPQYVAIAQFR